MSTVNMHQAKTPLSRLLEAAAKGEEIIIAKAGKPIAKLVPIDPFDRMLIAQAQLEGFAVVTSDPIFRHYRGGLVTAGSPGDAVNEGNAIHSGLLDQPAPRAGTGRDGGSV